MVSNHKYGRMRARAHGLIWKAKQEGFIPAASDSNCLDCGVQASEYDHRDYDKPYNVEPVCRRCNAIRGMALPGYRLTKKPVVETKLIHISIPTAILKKADKEAEKQNRSLPNYIVTALTEQFVAKCMTAFISAG